MEKILDQLLTFFGLFANSDEEKVFLSRLDRLKAGELDDSDHLALSEFCEAALATAIKLAEQGAGREAADAALAMLQALNDFEAILLLNVAQQGDWETYAQQLATTGATQGLNERLRLLSLVRGKLGGQLQFSDLDLESRYLVAGNCTRGTQETFAVDCGFFGSMTGAGYFIGLVKQSPEQINSVMAAIPATGEISREKYLEIVAIYRESLSCAGIARNFLRPFTRLLAMKRPDVFLCITSRNEKLLCAVLGLNKLNSGDYERYWDDYLMAIRHKMPWYSSPMPGDSDGAALWYARVALLDVFFYQAPQTSQLTTKLRQLIRAEETPISRQDAIRLMADWWRNQDNRKCFPAGFNQRDFIIKALETVFHIGRALGVDSDEMVSLVFQAALMLRDDVEEGEALAWLQQQLEYRSSTKEKVAVESVVEEPVTTD